MLIPIGTDAPVYHWPVITVGLIAVNTALFFLIGHPQEWMLSIGNGWYPLQWVTASFLHANVYHLVGNMIFLWAYGLVVEGKIGSWRFLVTYLLIAAFENLVAQTLFGFGGSGKDDQLRYVLGASGAICGLMAMALLWAPENTFTVVWGYKWGPYASATDHEISILGFSLWFIGWDLLAAVLYRFPLSTPVLHLLGAVIGFVVGVVFLQNRWVDCENYDLFTRWSGGSGHPIQQMKRIWKSASHQRQKKSSRKLQPLYKVIILNEAVGEAEQPRARKRHQATDVDWRTVK